MTLIPIATKSIFPNFGILLGVSILIFTSCSKLIEVDTPKTSISAKNVYTNDLTAASVLTGIYTNMSALGITGNDLSSIGLVTGLSGDELVLYAGSKDTRLRAYYQNNLKVITARIDFWTNIYRSLYTVNLSIEGLNNSSSLTPRVRQQLLGESKFLRAFYFFYLVNLYGDVPLVTSTDYATNNILSRTPKDQIWTQIITDLKEAKELLSATYLDGNITKETPERVRPTKWAATALLARCFLYVKDWKNAEIQATEIIGNSTLYNLESLDKVFLMNNREAIWQLQPVNENSNTEDAKTYIIPSTGPSVYTPVYASSQLLNSFETNDQRQKEWIDTISSNGVLYNYVYKYKHGRVDDPLGEYNTLLRLGEQYLIRSEARAQRNNLKASRDDLNTIRKRAGIEDCLLNEKSSLLSAIYHERQVELFTEWGHRWLDLKRTEMVNIIMSHVTTIKGGTWSTNWQLFPIPSSDIIANPNLSQNDGY